MDNASKALIMAGGILIAVLIISLSMYMVTSARGVASASEERLRVSQIESFNRFFVSYPQTIKGVDVYNILGKIQDINNDENAIAAAPEPIGVSLADVTRTENFNDTYSYRFEYGTNGIISRVIFSRIF